MPYNFTVAQKATHRIWGRIQGPTTNDDSFWVRVDNGAWMQWNDLVDGSTGWRWAAVHDTLNGQTKLIVSLAAGNHTLEIAYREDGAKLDKLLVTNDLNFVPSGLGN